MLPAEYNRRVLSIAALNIPAAGGQGVEGGGESTTAGSLVGDNVGGRSGAAAGGECVIEFATGYDNGNVRVGTQTVARKAVARMRL
jgi:hypothetical protein